MNLNQSQKAAFLKNIPNENYLRKEVLIPLFRNMEFQAVIDTHGNDEKGKDIVLVSKNKFNRHEYTAVIVKKDDITNATSAKDKEIIANVEKQIRMTINSGYDSLLEKKKVHFNSIIVTSSGNISNSAREAFVNMADQLKFSNIEYIDTNELIGYLDIYLPEAYVVSSGALSRYFHQLKTRCESLNELNNISLYDGKERKISDIFIEPKLIRKEEVIENKKPAVKHTKSTLVKLIEKPGHYLVKGNAGAGKTTLLRSLTLRLVADYEIKNVGRIPLLIKLKNLVREFKGTPEKHIKEYVSKEQSISVTELDKLFNENKIIVFLDGYDELTLQNEKDAFFSMLEYIEEIADTIVVTSRNNKFQTTNPLSEYRTWKVGDFSMRQISSFVRKWFSNKKERLVEHLKDHNLLDKLPNTPLVITLLAILFDADSNVEIPSNLSELYSMFTDLLLGKWNLDRRVESFYKANDKETFLEDLAFFMHQKNVLSCPEKEVQEVFRTTSKRLGRTFDTKKMLDELVNHTNLLCQNEHEEFEFRHLSFQEYFFAKKISLKSDINDIVKLLPSGWWDQVVYFYCGIRKENEDLLKQVYGRVSDLNDEKKLLHLLNFGYLIQSSYKTDASVRKDLMQASISEYANSIEDFISSIPEEFKIPKLLKYIMLMEVFALHYRSKYLTEIYESVHDALKAKDITDRNVAISLLVVSLLLAYNGKLDYLADNDEVFKTYPDILLLEEFFLRCELLEDEKEKANRKEIKGLSAKISRRIRKNPVLYKRIINEE